ncbi:3'(2'),5'-bisphosphate nucleotidase CysQ [Shewanella sp. NFH-SH190041]|uniref:3'(2'),5'-bisphosphate nucleotidase CysQ n=1 Tax=Shewanella sp. NFH-SH190041 TaxID=2950245 RepID=UPI0021C4C42A|nr:3'(2'),5'-bisphosphate nucleotidase CysQ [Shewanella sp. NFH-SH190041]BDM62653.1 3'(2'),5'-bisphosphate nucleotidase CysQ [Shewanella sp. NFH-SH190041]
MQPEKLLESVIAIARQAGDKIREIYLDGHFEREMKADNTPVTSADLASHSLILSRLAALTPDIPVISEEAADIALSERGRWPRYWLVDPLDGTGEFIAGSGDFSVIIALIEHNQPVLGVVYAPMADVCYYAVAGGGAFKCSQDGVSRISSHHIARSTHPALRLAVSRRQDPQSVLKLFHLPTECELVVMGGAALKSCLVAEGRADCYVRVGPTGEWDTGAAQIIVEEAGGQLMDIRLQPLSYNQRETMENPNFIVVGSPQLAWDKILEGR